MWYYHVCVILGDPKHLKYHTDVIVSRRRDLALTDCVVQRGWLFYVQMIEVNILRFTHHVGGRDLVFKKWQLREVNPFCLIHSNLEVLTPILAPMLTCFTVFLTKLHIFCCVLYMMYFIHKSSNLQRLVLLVIGNDTWWRSITFSFLPSPNISNSCSGLVKGWETHPRVRSYCKVTSKWLGP